MTEEQLAAFDNPAILRALLEKLQVDRLIDENELANILADTNVRFVKKS